MLIAETFEQGLPHYVEALRTAINEEQDVSKALARVEHLRQAILRLNTRYGIDRHFRTEQAESKVLQEYCASQKAQIAETPNCGESHG